MLTSFLEVAVNYVQHGRIGPGLALWQVQAAMCFGLTSSSLFYFVTPDGFTVELWPSRLSNLPALEVHWNYQKLQWRILLWTHSSCGIPGNMSEFGEDFLFLCVWLSFQSMHPQTMLSSYVNLKSHSGDMADRRGKMTSHGKQKNKAFVRGKYSGETPVSTNLPDSVQDEHLQKF